MSPTWIKSSLSFSNGNCVEVADLPDGTVGIRNSRDTDGPMLRFTPMNGLRSSRAPDAESSTRSAAPETGPEARDLWEHHEITLPQRQCSTRVRHPSRGLIQARTLMTLLSARTRGIGGSQGGKMRQSCLLSPS